MTLQTSGQITLNDISGEFGGSGDLPLSTYYAGGTYVPSGTEGKNGPIPSSGLIKLSDFYGAPVAPPADPTINFSFVADLGPTDGDIYGGSENTVGWTTVYQSGDFAYGSINSGDPENAGEGWGIASVVLVNQVPLPNDYGYTVNFQDTALQFNDFRIKITDPVAPDTVYARNATADSIVNVVPNGNVRSLWFDRGSGYYVDDWDGATISVEVENLG